MELGTLAELNVKDGDVVECVGSIDFGPGFDNGKMYIIFNGRVKRSDGLMVDASSINVSRFRIISRHEQKYVIVGRQCDIVTAEELKALVASNGDVYDYYKLGDPVKVKVERTTTVTIKED